MEWPHAMRAAGGDPGGGGILMMLFQKQAQMFPMDQGSGANMIQKD